jgi:UDP-glucose 4-epimerase
VSATVLITGVAGFIGSHVAAASRQKGWRVVGMDSLEPDEQRRAELTMFQRALLGSDAVTTVLQELAPDFCIHCAGQSSVPQSFTTPVRDFESGPHATFHLLDQLRQAVPQCRVVFLSSAAVYGNPTQLPVREDHTVAPLSPYGWHKWLTEQVCQEFVHLFNTPIAVARIFSAYGPGLRRQVLWDLCEKFTADGEVVLHGTGEESRDFVHINDIASGLLIIAERGEMKGNVYNLALGEEIPIRRLAESIRLALGQAERPFRFSGILPVGTPSQWRADITALRALGFAPQVSFEAGVATYVDWWRSQHLSA